MALAPQNVTVVIPGLNQKAPGNVAALGTLRRAENVRIEKGQNGSLAFRRRNGLVEVADTVSGNGFRMVSHSMGLILQQLRGIAVFTDGGFQKYVNGRLASLTPFAPPPDGIGVSRVDIALPLAAGTGAAPTTQSTRDVAIYQNVECVVWVDQGNFPRALLRDLATGQPVANYTMSVVASNKTKVVQLGGVFYAFWKEGNAIKATTIGAAFPYAMASPATTVVAAAFAGTDYDVQAGFDATHIALLYRSAAGTYVRCLLSTAFAVTTTVTDAVAADQPDVALCWADIDLTGASLRYQTLNAANGLKIQTINKATLAITATYSDATAIVANVTNMTGGGAALDTAAFALIESTVAYGGTTHHIVTAYGNGVGAVLIPDGGLASRAFSIGGQSYVWTIYNSAQATGTVAAPQPTLFLTKINASTGATIGTPVFTALKGIGPAYENFALSSVPADADGNRHVVSQHAIFIDTSAGKIVAQYGLSDIAMSPGSALIGNPLSFGNVAMFPPHVQVDVSPDAGAVHPLGIDIKPEVPRLTEGAAASGSIAPGTYTLLVRFKWIDAAGQIYRTAESTAVSITTVNVNSSIIVDTYPPSATFPVNSRIHVEVLRTIAGSDGSEYFKETPVIYLGSTMVPGLLTFVCTLSDTALSAGEPFVPFSAGGPLPPVAPPPFTDLKEHLNRACGINAEDPRRIECSNEYSPGTSLTWTGVIVLLAPEPLYALASMDGTLVGFAKENVYRWTGDLPDARGEGPSLPLAQIIPCGVGTDQPRSVVKTDLGVMFYSSKRGFHLLDRSLIVSYIGGAVETAAAGATISGATIHPTYPEVRFTSEGGTTFVFNTYWTKVAGTPIWTTFTGQACVHSITHNGKWYLLTSAGKLLEEDLTRWQDGVALNGGAFVAGTAFTRAVEIADINFAGINGFARVWEGALVAEWFASEMLKITTTLNHRRTDPATGLPATDNPFTFDATINPDPYVVKFSPAVQKMTSATVLIEDTTDFQTQGSEWQALNFVVGLRSGAYRQGAAYNMGGGQRK